ncbi:unnamed protein product [Linum trigynum]|uniref:Uncharacterized protein n=1 Tax=Linum trigynum TaxID=586398 RepID=A0AAV2E4E4_9ROSI
MTRPVSKAETTLWTWPLVARREFGAHFRNSNRRPYPPKERFENLNYLIHLLLQSHPISQQLLHKSHQRGLSPSLSSSFLPNLPLVPRGRLSYLFLWHPYSSNELYPLSSLSNNHLGLGQEAGSAITSPFSTPHMSLTSKHGRGRSSPVFSELLLSTMEHKIIIRIFFKNHTPASSSFMRAMHGHRGGRIFLWQWGELRSNVMLSPSSRVTQHPTVSRKRILFWQLTITITMHHPTCSSLHAQHGVSGTLKH